MFHANCHIARYFRFQTVFPRPYLISMCACPTVIRTMTIARFRYARKRFSNVLLRNTRRVRTNPLIRYRNRGDDGNGPVGSYRRRTVDEPMKSFLSCSPLLFRHAVSCQQVNYVLKHHERVRRAFNNSQRLVRWRAGAGWNVTAHSFNRLVARGAVNVIPNRSV